MKFRILAAFIAFVVLFSACKSSNKQGRYIPEEATFVVHFNGDSFLSKLPWEEIKKGEVYIDAIKDTSLSPLAKKIMDNPEESGLDIKNDVMMFIMKDSLGGYMAIQMHVKDAEKVSAMIKSLDETEVTQSGNYQVATSDKAIIQWDSKMLMFAVDIPSLNEVNKKYDWEEEEENENINEPTPRDMKGLVNYLFGLKEEKSLAKNDKFSDLMKEQGDLHFFFNAESMMKDMSDFGTMSTMFNMDKLYDNSYQTGTINFADGEIKGTFKAYTSKEIAAIFKKYQGRAIDKERADKVQSENIAFYFAFNYEPAFLRDYLKLLNMEGFANMALGMSVMSGLSMDDIMNFSKGEFNIIMSDIPNMKVERNDSIASYKMEEPNFLFTADIKDKNATEKIIKALKKTMGSSDDFHIMNDDKYLAMGNNIKFTQGYLTGTKKDVKFFDVIKGSIMGGYVDLKYIINQLEGISKDSATNAFQVYNSQFWEDAYITASKFKKDHYPYNGSVRLQNKGVNSLKQMYDYMNKAYVLMEKQKKTDEAYMETEVTPDIATED